MVFLFAAQPVAMAEVEAALLWQFLHTLVASSDFTEVVAVCSTVSCMLWHALHCVAW